MKRIEGDGFIAWLEGEKRHRLDGPAIEYQTGKKEWWIEDRLVYPRKALYAEIIYRGEIPLVIKQQIIEYELERL